MQMQYLTNPTDTALAGRCLCVDGGVCVYGVEGGDGDGGHVISEINIA